MPIFFRVLEIKTFNIFFCLFVLLLFILLILLCKKRKVSPFWQCRGRTFESVHGHGNRGEDSRKGPATINKHRGPTPALCSGNTGLGQGWLCTTCGSSPATIKIKKGQKFRPGEKSPMLKSQNLRLL